MTFEQSTGSTRPSPPLLLVPAPTAEIRCVVVSGSGDNPCGLAGLGLSEEGTVAVSLGTSDTIMGITRQPIPQEEVRGSRCSVYAHASHGVRRGCWVKCFGRRAQR